MMAKVRSHTTNPMKVKRLPSSLVEITLHSDQTFSASFHGLAEHVDEPGMRVSIAVGAGGTSAIYDFGTVAHPFGLAHQPLDGLDPEKPRVWRLLVWDEQDKRIVASNERLRARDQNVPAEREPLLPVRLAPLGGMLWKLALHDETAPELLVNSAVPKLKQQLNAKPELRGAIVPEATRQCLMHVYENCDFDESDGGAWQSKWMRFADGLTARPVDWPEIEREAAREWSDSVVSALSNHHGFAKAVAALWGDNDD